MTAVPVVAVPVATPAPVTTVPTPMAMAPMAVVPVMSPPHFFRFEAIDLVAGGDGWMGIFIGGRPSNIQRLRRKWRGLCAGSQGGGSGGKSKGEFYKIPALHDVSSFVEVTDRVSQQ